MPPGWEPPDSPRCMECAPLADAASWLPEALALRALCTCQHQPVATRLLLGKQLAARLWLLIPAGFGLANCNTLQTLNPKPCHLCHPMLIDCTNTRRSVSMHLPATFLPRAPGDCPESPTMAAGSPRGGGGTSMESDSPPTPSRLRLDQLPSSARPAPGLESPARTSCWHTASVWSRPHATWDPKTHNGLYCNLRRRCPDSFKPASSRQVQRAGSACSKKRCWPLQEKQSHAVSQALQRPHSKRCVVWSKQVACRVFWSAHQQVQPLTCGRQGHWDLGGCAQTCSYHVCISCLLEVGQPCILAAPPQGVCYAIRLLQALEAAQAWVRLQIVSKVAIASLRCRRRRSRNPPAEVSQHTIATEGVSRLLT